MSSCLSRVSNLFFGYNISSPNLKHGSKSWKPHNGQLLTSFTGDYFSYSDGSDCPFLILLCGSQDFTVSSIFSLTLSLSYSNLLTESFTWIGGIVDPLKSTGKLGTFLFIFGLLDTCIILYSRKDTRKMQL